MTIEEVLNELQEEYARLLKLYPAGGARMASFYEEREILLAGYQAEMEFFKVKIRNLKSELDRLGIKY